MYVDVVVLPPFNASQEVSISLLIARAKPVTIEFFTVSAICLTASKSPGDEAGNPASIMVTPYFSS